MPTIPGTKNLGNVWVLWYQPSDGTSNSCIKRAYEEESRAKEDHILVKDNLVKNYFLDNVLLYKHRAPMIESMEDKIGIWILWWLPSDSQGCGCIERAYEEEERAGEDFALAEDHPTRNYFLDNILLYRRHAGIDK